ncbi:MAG: DUF4278 domain-containing protein [Stenomitos rutilans HA7619-LM2]|jgi:hypothetical protein|nr:DUF4278 domain-containing protein [Stenomitos rutilans HA7619-LM2]
MQLTYRGVNYDYHPRSAEAARETTVYRTIRPIYNLHYRGVVYAVDPNAEPVLPSVRSSAQLTYRGVAYALNGGEHPIAVQNRASAVSSKPHFQRKASNNAEFVTTHRSNLRTNVQRRLQIAREQGDQNLVSLLERELQQIV